MFLEIEMWGTTPSSSNDWNNFISPPASSNNPEKSSGAPQAAEETAARIRFDPSIFLSSKGGCLICIKDWNNVEFFLASNFISNRVYAKTKEVFGFRFCWNSPGFFGEKVHAKNKSSWYEFEPIFWPRYHPVLLRSSKPSSPAPCLQQLRIDE